MRYSCVERVREFAIFIFPLHLLDRQNKTQIYTLSTMRLNSSVMNMTEHCHRPLAM
jgi:hypothetical protein